MGLLTDSSSHHRVSAEGWICWGSQAWEGTRADGFRVLLQAWLGCHCFLTRQRPQGGLLVSVWTLWSWKLLFGALTATGSLCPASQALARLSAGRSEQVSLTPPVQSSRSPCRLQTPGSIPLKEQNAPQTCLPELSLLEPHWPLQATVRSERHLVVPGAPRDSPQTWSGGRGSTSPPLRSLEGGLGD